MKTKDNAALLKRDITTAVEQGILSKTGHLKEERPPRLDQEGQRDDGGSEKERGQRGLQRSSRPGRSGRPGLPSHAPQR
jgi:hypothetical protein